MADNLTAMQFLTLVQKTSFEGPVTQNALGRLVDMDATVGCAIFGI
ncbi:MAG: hypothetical protein ABJU46_06610 [Paracoccaceae bacterium]